MDKQKGKDPEDHCVGGGLTFVSSVELLLSNSNISSHGEVL